MRIVILALCCVAVQSVAVSKEEKTCDQVHYDKEVLKTGIPKPYSFAVDLKKNIVYFSYDYNHPDYFYKTGKINLDTKEYSDINGVDDGFALTVDQKNNAVYIGSNKGIYKYDEESQHAELFGLETFDIWDIFYKDSLYFIKSLAFELYKFENGHGVIFKDLEGVKVNRFVIDKDDDMFYSNDTGFYSQKKGTKDVVIYKKPNVVNNLKDIRRFTIDANGNTYACLRDGIYKFNKINHSLDKVLHIDDAFALAFDRDNNIVYGNEDTIVYLKPNKNIHCPQ